MWKTPGPQALAIGLFTILAAPAGHAGDVAGRFSLMPSGSAFLRLDSATGAISACSQKEGGFVCEAVADDALALKREIDRLAEENEALKQKIAAQDEALKASEAKEAPAPDTTLKAPELDLDKVADLASRLLKRFEDMVRSLKQEEAEKEL